MGTGLETLRLHDPFRVVATTLLEMIVESWVTIRGFSFAGAWPGGAVQTKDQNKKTLKHSKGIRKALFTSKTEFTTCI